MASKPTISTAHKLWSHIKRWGKNSPAYIVIHFTGGFSSNSDGPGGMLYTYKSYVERGSNAHYLVGAYEIWEMVDPKTHYCTYSCGSAVGKKNPCTLPGWYGGKLAMSHAGIAGHSNTINVELCSCKAGMPRCNPNDPDWYFSTATYVHAVQLVAWLCEEFSIKIDHIIMHNQITGKLCPAMWCSPAGDESGLEQFRRDVAILLNDMQEDTPVSPSPEPEQGFVNVAAGGLFHSRATEDSPIVGQSATDAQMKYTCEQNGFYYTDMGWIQA